MKLRIGFRFNNCLWLGVGMVAGANICTFVLGAPFTPWGTACEVLGAVFILAGVLVGLHPSNPSEVLASKKLRGGTAEKRGDGGVGPGLLDGWGTGGENPPPFRSSIVAAPQTASAINPPKTGSGKVRSENVPEDRYSEVRMTRVPSGHSDVIYSPSVRMQQIIEEIAAATDQSNSKVVLHAISLYKAVKLAEAAGGYAVLYDKDGEAVSKLVNT